MKTLLFWIVKDDPMIKFKSFDSFKYAEVYAEGLKKDNSITSIVIHYPDETIETIK